MHRKIVLVGAVLMALVVLASCGGESADESSAQTAPNGSEIQPPDEISDRGRIVYCTDPTYPVAEFMEGEELKGFDIDTGEEIASRMGIVAEWTHMGFNALIPAVGSNCDAIISGLTRTPEREQEIDFVSYVLNHHGVLVQAGNPLGINSFEDLSGHSVSVLGGTLGVEQLEELNEELNAEGRTPARIVEFPKDDDAANALRAGQVDAYTSGMPSLGFYTTEFPDIFERVPDVELDPLPYGIGLEKGNSDLQDALQAAVDAMYDDGTMLEILERWGVGAAALEQ